MGDMVQLKPKSMKEALLYPGGPKPPKPLPGAPAPMPMEDQKATEEAKKRASQRRAAGGGRASTILGGSLGGSLGTEDKLGA